MEDKIEYNTKDKDDKSGNYEKICYMCRRPESKTGAMISMPGGIDICPDCIQKTFNSMQSMDMSKLSGITNIDDIKNIDLSSLNIPNMNVNPIPERARVKKRDKKRTEPLFTMKDVPAPHKIKEMLDEYVIGQDVAKKVISVAVYNHYKRIFLDKDKEGTRIEKSNILMIGPTGSGKTYLVKTLAKLLNVPLAIADATSLTEAGYIGDDIESVISKLLLSAGNDVERAECGIVFIDEIDKIAKKKNTNTRDVSGESVQQELLKLLEGSKVAPMETVNTDNILFICGGAFPALDDIIKERLQKNTSVGFNSDLKDKYDNETDLYSKVTNEDIRKFGMIPEFIGRLPVICTLSKLDKDAFKKILNEPKNAILKQYKRLLELDEVELVFDDDATDYIAEQAMKKDTGARALRSIIEEFMLDIMYEIPKDKNIGRVIITRDYLEHKGAPNIVFRNV